MNPQVDTRETLVPYPLTRSVYIVSALLFIISVIEIQFAKPSRTFFKQTIDALKLDKITMTANYLSDHLVWVIVALAVWRCWPAARATILPAILAVGLASLLTGIGKEITGRMRPHTGMVMSKREGEVRWVENHIANHPKTKLRVADEDQWMWLSEDRPWFTGRVASYPSGHATSVATFAVWLSLLLPRATFIWYSVVILMGLARIDMDRHYPGDVIAGTAVGYLTARMLFANVWLSDKSYRLVGWLERLFARIYGLLPFTQKQLPS